MHYFACLDIDEKTFAEFPGQDSLYMLSLSQDHSVIFIHEQTNSNSVGKNASTYRSQIVYQLSPFINLLPTFLVPADRQSIYTIRNGCYLRRCCHVRLRQQFLFYLLYRKGCPHQYNSFRNRSSRRPRPCSPTSRTQRYILFM